MSAILKKERTEVENAAEKLLKHALQAGAEAAEVAATYHTATRIKLEKQDFQMVGSDEGYQLGLRVLKGHKQGFASCNTTDTKALKEIALRSVEIAGFSVPNEHQTILSTNHVSKDCPVETWSEGLAQMSVQTQKELSQGLLNEALKDSRFRLNDAEVGLTISGSLILNSLGTHKWEPETTLSWSLMGMASAGNVITSFDYCSGLVRKVENAARGISVSTRNLCGQLVRNLKEAKGHDYKGRVVFSPRAVIDIFLSGLGHHLNGRNVYDQTSRWSRQSLNTLVFSKDIHLTDNPWMNDRAQCSSFDREGVPTQPLVLIEHGNLKHFMLDSYASHALELPATGHAAGGASSVPTVGGHTWSLSSGTRSLQEIVGDFPKNQAEYLMVHRFSGQIDPVTGDFSGVAKGGEWFSRTELIGCVKETLISGNLFECLSESLVALSHETEVVDCSDESPFLIADNVSVTTGK